MFICESCSLPSASAATISLSPDSLLEEKRVQEKCGFQQWDPGIGTVGVEVDLILVQKNLIHDALLRFCNSPASKDLQDDKECQKDDESWFYAKDDGSFFKSGHWGLKNLKDAESSIPSSPPNKPKRLNQIWKSMAICWPHLSYLGLMFVSIFLLVDGFRHVGVDLSCIPTVVADHIHE